MNPMLGKALLLTNINQMEYFKTRHKPNAIFFSRVDARLVDIAKQQCISVTIETLVGQKLRPTLFILISECICKYFNIPL